MRIQRPFPRTTHGQRFVGPLLVIVGSLTLGAARADEPKPDASAKAVLHLTNSGFVTGEFADSNQPATLRWKGSAFVSPFEFAANSVDAVLYPPKARAVAPKGEYCFELAGGDVVFGSLVSLDDKEAEIDVPSIGRLHFARASVHRIYRQRGSGDLIYLGPNGLIGWTESSAKKAWRDESGQPVSEQAGTTIRGDFGLPARALIEFELSWKTKPDFVFAVGVGDDAKSVERAFRFEVWEKSLVVERETEAQADVSSVQELANGPGRIQLLAYLDQERGRILVLSAAGKTLANLAVADPKVPPARGISLANLGGDIRLEKLRISRWNGDPPVEVRGDESRIHRADGGIVHGQIAGFDPGTKEFLMRDEKAEHRIKQEEIASVFLSQPGEEKPRSVRAVCHDGTRLSGDLVEVRHGNVRLSMPGVKETASLSQERLRSIGVIRHSPSQHENDRQTGLLEMEGTRIRGRFADGREQQDASCLAWQPLASNTASALRPGQSGRVVYRETPPVQAPPQQMQGVVIFNNAAVRQALVVAQPENRPGGGRALYLRTGDIIPGEVKSIDETGVRIRTPLSQSTFVPHDKIKAAEIAPADRSTAKLSPSKRDRLLTLPRMQKESPPTHLIRSRNGDYLRGRLVAMDNDMLKLEVRLETKEIPRNRVARIIWLHPETLNPPNEPGKPAEAKEGTTVQVLRNDGIRLTFQANLMAGGTLSGKSDILGDCRVRLADVDQLYFGGAIEKAAAQLAYQQWILRGAVEPKVSQSDAEGNQDARAAGTESELVGKPAPDFELELLGGEKFSLARSKGKVIVLDFWATWCGPCIQAMPQVERVVGEFPEREVQLIAVNLQETPKQIAAMLERHKLHVTVALDKNGRIAETYRASAIPQTVVIDREGTITRLFVGGGPHLGDQLRDALTALVQKANPKPAAK